MQLKSKGFEMVVSVFSTKGGVGKTVISYSLAKDLGMRYITNDFSAAVNAFSIKNQAKHVIKNIPFYEDTIYDFGGFKDSNVDEIIAKSDLLIIPMVADVNSIMKGLQAISKYKHTRKLVVGNMVENEKDRKALTLVMNKYFPDEKLVFFRKGRLLRNSLEEKKSATELYRESAKNKLHYKSQFSDYETVLNLLKSLEKPKEVA